MSLLRSIYKTCFALALVGCSAMPASGPYSRYVDNGASLKISTSPNISDNENNFNYAVIDVNYSTMNLISKNNQDIESTDNWPINTSPEVIKVSVGDKIQVTIYESQSGGLFIPKEAGVRPGNFISLPPQTIEESGYITVPYVGLVRAAGRTTVDIENSITNSLVDKAIEPQVVVSFVDRNGFKVSVIGDVEEDTLYSIDFGGDTILNAIASAGGPSSPGYETQVSLQRGNKEYIIPFDQLISNPEKNIYVKSNDTVYLYREPKIYTVYGATGLQGSIPFGERKLFLSDALGRANGFNDAQADPSGIFVYRHEAVNYIKKFTNAENMPSIAENSINNTVPVIYKINLRDPNGFFLAQKFAMKNNDILYVSNAKSVEFLKFLNILNNTASTATNTKNTKNSF